MENRLYAIPKNVYQAVWIGTKKQVQQWQTQCSYLDPPTDAGKYAHFFDLVYREWASCLQLFENCSVQKVVPLKAVKEKASAVVRIDTRFLVLHMANDQHVPPFHHGGGFRISELDDKFNARPYVASFLAQRATSNLIT